MRFISLTKKGNPVSYNTKYIVAIAKTYKGTVLIFHDNSSVTIEETYDAVMKQIREADE